MNKGSLLALRDQKAGGLVLGQKYEETARTFREGDFMMTAKHGTDLGNARGPSTSWQAG
jgi:hypothetical protein